MWLLLDILLWILLALAASGLLYWLVVLWRVLSVLKRRPTIRAGLDLTVPDGEHGPPKVSVVIPVHNEQRVIDACCASLRRQDYPNIEIIFVLDRCTDDTAKLLAPHAASDDRIIIVENEHRPEDWTGKCHAAHIGAGRATGEWLLFTDADTIFDPALVRASVALSAEREYALLSLLSTLTYHHRFERIAQPVATMALIRMFPLERGSRHERRRPFANGQFMLFQRDWYERIGGHENVRKTLLEDLRFARLVAGADGDWGVVLADGMLTCSMYDTMAAFTSGWKRIFIEATSCRVRRLRKMGWRLRLVGAGLPLVQVSAVVLAAALGWLGDPGLAAGVLGVVVGGMIAHGLALARIYAASGAPLSSIFLYPLGAWVVGGLMLAAASDLRMRRPVVWGGMQYVLEPR